MKKLLALYCALVVSMAILAAQTAPRTASGASSTTSPQTITVTGCVTPDTMANPTTDSPRFVLSGIEPQGGAGNPSASPAAQTPSTVTGYTLKPAADVNLGAHLNHKVQITGTLDTATSSPTSAQPSSPNTSSAMPALRVTSVKMVSSTCP
jgi:hypothetical protein